MDKQVSIKNNKVIISGESPDITIEKGKYNIEGFQLTGKYLVDAETMSLLIAAYTKCSVYKSNIFYESYSLVDNIIAYNKLLDERDTTVKKCYEKIEELNNQISKDSLIKQNTKEYIKDIYKIIDKHNKKYIFGKVKINKIEL